MERSAAAIALLGAAAAVVAADDDLGKRLAAAETKLTGETPLLGVIDYGRALAGVQKKGDVQAEQRVALAMRRALSRQSADFQRLALDQLVGPLADERSGAFASAHAFATTSLVWATKEGDTELLKWGAKALASYSPRKRKGASAKAVAAYARGMAAVAAGKDDDAAEYLEEALEPMAAEDWPRLATCVGTELAAVQLRRGKEKAARKALEHVAAMIVRVDDPVVAAGWQRLVMMRLGDAPEDVVAPAQATRKKFEGRTGSAGDAGSGAPGLNAGEDPRSALGKAFDKFSKTKPLVSVKRSEAGFEIRYAFAKKFRHVVPFGPAVVHHQDFGNGVWLSFWGRSVSLAGLSLEKRGDGLDGASMPGRFEVYYPLARGETWGVNKKGEVTIR